MTRIGIYFQNYASGQRTTDMTNALVFNETIRAKHSTEKYAF